MKPKTILTTLALALAAVIPALAQLPEGSDGDSILPPTTDDKPVAPSKAPAEFQPEFVLIGLQDDLFARNATEVNDSEFAHYYESQEQEFKVAVKLLRGLLETNGFSSEVKWKTQQNKGRSIYSPEGIMILNQYLEPVATGMSVQKGKIIVAQVGNYYDFAPAWESITSDEDSPYRTTMRSLLAGFLLRAEKKGEVHAKDGGFARKMLEYMLLEGCVFDDYSIHTGTPQTLHLKLRPSKSISEVLSYVEKQRESVKADKLIEPAAPSADGKPSR